MFAHIAAHVSLDAFLSSEEIESTLALPYTNEYDAFVFGGWKSAILLNGTGSHLDSTLREYEGVPKKTELAARVPGAFRLLSNCFETSRLRWARLFLHERGVLLPHVDFIGMKNGFTRLHVPLRTNAGCLHSEGDDVYHMRPGEVWALHVAEVHSACNQSTSARVSLCLDFEPGLPLDALVRPAFRDTRGKPEMVNREPITGDDIHAYSRMASRLTEHQIKDVAGKLALVHFEKEVHAGAMFDWLAAGAEETRNPRIISKARALRDLALGAEKSQSVRSA